MILNGKQVLSGLLTTAIVIASGNTVGLADIHYAEDPTIVAFESENAERTEKTWKKKIKEVSEKGYATKESYSNVIDCSPEQDALLYGVSNRLGTSPFSLAAFISEKKQENVVPTLEERLSEIFVTDDAAIGEYLNVRTEPDQESELYGMLYPRSGGEVLERKGEWARILSGHVEGWVNAEYIISGEELLLLGETISLEVTDPIVNVRKGPTTNAAVVDTVSAGTVLEMTKYLEGWIAVSYNNDMSGYIWGESVAFRAGEENAITYVEKVEREAEERRRAEEAERARIAAEQEAARLAAEREAARIAAEREAARIAAEQEAARIAAEQEAARIAAEQEAARIAAEQEAARQAQAAAAAAAAAKNADVANQINAIYAQGRSAFTPYYPSADEMYLFACTIMMESGSTAYVGKLAVASVILNRLRTGHWGNTLTSVIYAPGQFTGVGTGLINTYLASGPNQECIVAAYEACAGINNIGDYLYFITTGKAQLAKYSSYTIINNQTFYNRVWY